MVFIISSPLFSQDQIYKRNNEIIDCKVTEIGMDDIKYTLPDYPSDLQFSISKDNVLKIIFENGKEMFFQLEMTNPENYILNKKNAIKVDFLSPLTGNTTFSFERSLKPGRSVEAGLGIIGLGRNTNRQAAGFFTKFGIKYIKDPDFYLRGMRYAHVLKGGYIKPELTLGYYTKVVEYWIYDNFPPYNSYSVEEQRDVFIGSVMVNIGKQWIFDNSFLFDIYGSIGYYIDSEGEDWDDYHFGFIGTGDELPLAFSGGFKIGWLIK